MTQKKQIQPKRLFSEEFKKSVVNEFEGGKFTVKELSALYNVTAASIYLWIYRYSVYPKKAVKIVEMADSASQKLKELQKKIAELERVVGQKQLNIDFLEKMIELAK